MKELIAAYFAGLFLVSIVPSQVDVVPFVNLSQGIQFEIDEKSPVVSAEKDLLALEKKEIEELNKAKWSNLNQLGPRKVARHKPVVVDYSANLQEIQSQKLIALRGPLQLKQGLALTDENRIEVHQEYNGKILEYGDVDVNSGTYAIQVTQMVGELCAKLKSSRSEVMGRGCVPLAIGGRDLRSQTQGPLLSISKYQDVFELAEKAKPLPQIESIEPAQQDMAGKIYDYYGYNSDQPRVIENAKIETSSDGAETQSSYIITQISAPQYIPTRVVSNKNTAKRSVPLLAANAAKALGDIARDLGYTDGDLKTRGTLWGRVFQNGKTVAGAEVTLDGSAGSRPLYLNELYIPDPNQKATASHGLYTFMNLPDGEYAVRADRGNEFIGFQNASVRVGTLALADIEASAVRSEVVISTFEISSKVAIPSVVTLQNYHEDIVLDEGHGQVLTPQTRDNSYALVHPLNRDYLTTQHLIRPDDREIQLPQIHRNWMENLLSQAKLSRAVYGKIILGFGPPEPFKAYAIGSEKAQVVYFDSNGQVIDGNFGSAGGGYLILDPEEHVVEFAVQRAGSQQLEITYMPTTPGVVSIIR